ncbi:MAG: hypothetical protein L0Y54_07695, partial [Sporichthyaceae bacterium]|nr:hypothetical protein [Sporichthyaceae bacterium]
AVTRARRRAGVGIGDVRTVVRGTPGEGYFAGQEAMVVASLLPGVAVIDPAALIGDTYGASAAFGVAVAIVDAATGDRPGVSLVTSVDQDGQVACAVVRPMGRL